MNAFIKFELLDESNLVILDVGDSISYLCLTAVLILVAPALLTLLSIWKALVDINGHTDLHDPRPCPFRRKLRKQEKKKDK